MKIRLAELPVSGDPEECVERAVHFVKLRPLPDVVVFPELFSMGFVLEKIPEYSLHMADLEGHPLALAAAETGVSVVGGTFPVRTEKGLMNMLPVWNGEGKLVHTAEKVHLFRNMGEDTVFTGGAPSGVFDLYGTACAASVCYDLRFPELFRIHALNGAEIVFLPAEWPEPRLGLFRCFLRARAGEAQIFVVGCNLGGEHLGVRFGGGGGVASPAGKLLESVEVDLHVRDFSVDIDDIGEQRRRIFCLEDRRPSEYGVWM